MYKSAMADNAASLNEEFLQRHYPLHWACFHGNDAYVRELLMSGRADVYQEDGLHGWTPMHWAASQGKWKCLEVLGESGGVDLEAPNTRVNQTVAHVAAIHGQVDCVAWLVQRGISLGIQDHMGDTALHKAAQCGHLECVRLLISHGLILSTFNRNGQTPQDLARQHGHPECQAYLEQALSSQHTGFYPTNSSPILMNGEGIYQNGGPLPHHHHMEMAEDMVMGGEGDSANGASFLLQQQQQQQPRGGCKRSFDDEEHMPFKRQRLFGANSEDKMGTANNNNIVSSYQGVLAMSVEPLKSPSSLHHHTLQVPMAAGNGVWQREGGGGAGESSSMVDHCNALTAQHSYDHMMLSELITADHGS